MILEKIIDEERIEGGVSWFRKMERNKESSD